MRIAVAMLGVFALLLTTPSIVFGQSSPPPTSPAPSSGASMGTTIEGVVTNVDSSCGGKAPADCLAIVEVKASPAGTSKPGTAPSGSSTPSSGYSTSSPSTSASGSQTTKIMIPKSLKITSQASGASSTTPVKLATGDKVKITFEKKQDVNVATAVTITKSGS